MREKRAKALPGVAAERRPDGVLRQPAMAVTPRHLARQHRTDSAMDIPDRTRDAHWLAALKRRLRRSDQLVVERPVEMVLLPFAIVDHDTRFRRLLIQQARQVDPLGLPMVDRPHHVELVAAADHFLKGAETELSHQLAHFLGDEEEIVDDVLGLTGEALAQYRVLRSDPDRTGIEVAFAHHD